ncbi:hypothetical protein [Campylobacter hyointestinalis]|nr:hypothetical protein [Campylobacter hyointestinalis]
MRNFFAKAVLIQILNAESKKLNLDFKNDIRNCFTKNRSFLGYKLSPNGWGCRCKVQVLTKAEIERKGLTPLADSSILKNVAGKDFAYNPGKFNKIEQIYEQKIGKFSKADSATSKIFVNNVLAKTKDFNRQRDLYVWQRGLNSMIDNISSGNIIKDKNLQ